MDYSSLIWEDLFINVSVFVVKVFIYLKIYICSCVNDSHLYTEIANACKMQKLELYSKILILNCQFVCQPWGRRIDIALIML